MSFNAYHLPGRQPGIEAIDRDPIRAFSCHPIVVNGSLVCCLHPVCLSYSACASANGNQTPNAVTARPLSVTPRQTLFVAPTCLPAYLGEYEFQTQNSSEVLGIKGSYSSLSGHRHDSKMGVHQDSSITQYPFRETSPRSPLQVQLSRWVCGG